MERLVTLIFAATFAAGLALESPPQAPVRPRPQPPQASPIEKLGENLFRLGNVRVDTAKRELVVSGSVNPVRILEFIANPTRGLKAYESALTLDTDAITFNAALVLMGLDKSHSRPATRHFDPADVEGDPVEIWVETAGPPPQRFRAERLAYDETTKQTIPDSPWLYTGSSFLKDGRFWADADGVLVSFVHDPASLIELPRGTGMGRYGSIVLNPNLGLAPQAPVTVTVKALSAPPKPQ